jgi:hypothetical protein
MLPSRLLEATISPSITDSPGRRFRARYDRRESLAEILSVARGEVRAPVALDSDSPVTVELEL